MSCEKRLDLRHSGKNVHFGILPYCRSEPFLYITDTAGDLSRRLQRFMTMNRTIELGLLHTWLAGVIERPLR